MKFKFDKLNSEIDLAKLTRTTRSHLAKRARVGEYR